MSEDSEDVWSPGEDYDGPHTTELGTVAYGEVRPMWRAMNPVAVLVWGAILFMEAPVIGLLGGGAYWLTSMLPGFLGIPVDIALEGLALGSKIDPTVKEGLSQLATLLLQLFFWPFQTAATAGTLFATASYIYSDEIDLELLWNAQRFARLMVVQILTSCIVIATFAVTAVPLGGAAYGIWVATQSLEAVIVAGLAGMLLSFVPVIYVSVSMAPATWMVVLDDLTPLEALAESWFTTHLADKFMLMLLGACTAYLSTFAACMCLVPALFVWAIILPGQAAMWLSYSRTEEDVAGMKLFERYSG